MSTSAKPNYILVGSISGAFGVKGEIKVKTFTALPENCMSYGPLLDKNGQLVFEPVSFRPIKDALAVICEGISTPEQANALRGIELYVPRDALPKPDDEDDFYYDTNTNHTSQIHRNKTQYNAYTEK